MKSQTTIHRQTVIIQNGIVVNETHTVETVSKSAPIVTVLAVNATTLAVNATTLAANATTLAANATFLAANATTLAVNVTTIAPEVVTPVVLNNTNIVESKPNPKSNYTVYKSTSITVIRKKNPILPSNLFQKMIDILNQHDRIIPQIEVPEDSNIVVEKFHY